MRGIFGGALQRRRQINWRWPLRLWFNSGAEFWSFVVWLIALLGAIALGFYILSHPGA